MNKRHRMALQIIIMLNKENFIKGNVPENKARGKNIRYR
jgi:hypothetical protein